MELAAVVVPEELVEVEVEACVWLPELSVLPLELDPELLCELD